ncbi:WD repeat-containing protein 46-like [Watersipora subatra]|uniref:WD repeat-containing protein 46-like n=1 Tax=Watersipora subatra TaxID=2589382 RepID=UPI00355C394A
MEARSRKKRKEFIDIPVAPTKDQYRATQKKKVKERERIHKHAAQEHRRRLREAKKAGDEKEIVRLMRVRELENIVESREDNFSGDLSISKAQLARYDRTKAVDTNSKFTRRLEKTSETEREARRAAHSRTVMSNAVRQAAKSEFMLAEEAGLLQADEGEATADISQHDIVKCVDIQSAQKHFTLSLKDCGPYHLDYSSNGRYLALAGKLGHSAVIDWQPKSLKCEFNVMESCHDIKCLHNETMMALAQRQWVYIYDNEGVELHCLKVLDSPLQLQFLPFHFLLACSNSKGYLSWLDVSVGEKVAGTQTHRGRLGIMAQNPCNAIIHLAHSKGTVSLWSPNSNTSLVEMLCHNSALRSLCVDNTGNYMATSGMDRKVKIWDLRKYQCMHEFKVHAGAGSMHFSSQGLLAASMGNTVYVYKDTLINPPTEAYMSHVAQGSIQQVQFCPYEDVLGVGSAGGFESLLIPGSGEPNFDAMEANPYQSKKQRQTREVKQLLDKVPHHLITLAHDSITSARAGDAIVPEKNKVPKKWLKMHYKPSKSSMESKRRWELKEKLAKAKKERTKEYAKAKKNPPPYDPLARFKFGG